MEVDAEGIVAVCSAYDGAVAVTDGGFCCPRDRAK